MSSGMPPPHMMSFSFASNAKGESLVESRDSSRALKKKAKTKKQKYVESRDNNDNNDNNKRCGEERL